MSDGSSTGSLSRTQFVSLCHDEVCPASTGEVERPAHIQLGLDNDSSLSGDPGAVDVEAEVAI